MAATTVNPLTSKDAFAASLGIEQYPSAIEKSMLQASIQLEAENEIKENYLVVSPYDEFPHLLDLRTLDTANQLLAKALVSLKCLRPDYATAPYADIFNLPKVIEDMKVLAAASNLRIQKASFYIVVFRSRIPKTTAYADLGILDKAAHAEATASGGFLKYWFGTPDNEGRNLATCVWRSQEDARTGSVGEAHRKAAGATRLLYTEWRIERLKLTIQDDASDWEIAEWDQ